MLLKQDFFFRSLGANRPLHIRVPDEGEGPFPVMYFFDGHNLFRDEDATYGTCWGLDRFMAESSWASSAATSATSASPNTCPTRRSAPG